MSSATSASPTLGAPPFALAADEALGRAARALALLRAHGRSAAALLLAVVVAFPFAWLVQLSLRPSDALFDGGLAFVPTLDAYRALWHGSFARSFLNSLLVSGLSTTLSLAIGVPAAYVLARWRFRARGRVALWILVTRMAPPIAFTIPFFLAFRYAGLQDTIWGLALVYLSFNLAVVIWLMQGFFEAVPIALEEAAWIDG
jgi:multiple sugar transport system permease protein